MSEPEAFSEVHRREVEEAIRRLRHDWEWLWFFDRSPDPGECPCSLCDKDRDDE